MIDEKTRSLFIHIPKCGGTYIEKHVTPKVDWHSRGEKHLSLAESIALYGVDKVSSAYRFTVVRNPYERAVSGFLYYHRNDSFPFESTGFYERLRIQLANRSDRDCMNSLKDYMRAILSRGINKEDWFVNDIRPASEFLRSANNIEMCDVFKLERIDEWLPLLSQKLSCSFENIRVNAAPKYDAYSFIDCWSARAIEELYEEDFKQFYPELPKLSRQMKSKLRAA